MWVDRITVKSVSISASKLGQNRLHAQHNSKLHGYCLCTRSHAMDNIHWRGMMATNVRTNVHLKIAAQRKQLEIVASLENLPRVRSIGPALGQCHKFIPSAIRYSYQNKCTSGSRTIAIIKVIYSILFLRQRTSLFTPTATRVDLN